MISLSLGESMLAIIFSLLRHKYILLGRMVINMVIIR